MAISVVQVAQLPGAGGNVISFVGAPAPGNSLILVTGSQGNGPLLTVTDNQTGNRWFRGANAMDSAIASFSAACEVWYVPSCVYQSGTFSVTEGWTTPANGGLGSFLMEVSGITGVQSRSGQATDVGAASTSLTATAGAANPAADALVVCIFATTTGNSTDFLAGPTTGYTSKAVYNAGNQGGTTTGGYKVVSAVETSAATSPAFTASKACGVVATFMIADTIPDAGSVTESGVAPSIVRGTVRSPGAWRRAVIRWRRRPSGLYAPAWAI